MINMFLKFSQDCAITGKRLMLRFRCQQNFFDELVFIACLHVAVSF